MNNVKILDAEDGYTLKVRVCNRHGEPLKEGEVPELPELRDFLESVYATHKALAENAS